MSDFDLTAPSMPYQKKKEGGILKKLFGKKEEPAQPVPSPPAAPQQENVNLDEIKRKLGLDEELPPLQPEPAPVTTLPPAPAEEPKIVKTEEKTAEKIEIQDWTVEDTIPVKEEPNAAPGHSEWSAPAEERYEAKQASPFTLDPHEEETSAGVHHEVVDEHLAPLDKAHSRVEQALQKIEPAQTTALAEVPEWKLQPKEIPPESYFILRNGQPVRSLKELIEVIDYIDDSTFDHHVNEYRNDFANWIRDAISDAALADEVAQASDKTAVTQVLRAHYQDATKKVSKEQEKIQTIFKKREETLKKLGTVEEQIETLRRQLASKSQELLGERKRSAKLIKEKLDEEVRLRLATEKRSLTEARQELARAKQEQLARAAEYENLIKSLGAKEKELLLKEQKANKIMQDAQEASSRLAEEKRSAAQLLKDSEMLKRQFEEMKRLDAQTKKMVELVDKRNAEIKRREDAIAQREQKITADLTRVHEEQERLASLKDEHAKREAAAKKMEADARKIMSDAESRSKEALDTERETRDRLKEDQKKLETLRKQIDGTLAKALGQKKKITTAVALRKELEKAISTTKREVAQERQEMEQEAYKSYMESKIETTPAGQPDMPHGDEVLMMRKDLPIYQKVEECRQALDRRDLETAKRLYNELRDEYTKIKVDTTERSAIYTSIRELYDDIHLMMLG